MKENVQIRNLSEVHEKEIIYVNYPNPYKSFTGYKHDVEIMEAMQESKRHKCKLFVWRDIDKNIKDLSVLTKYSSGELIKELQSRGLTVSVR